MDGSNMPRAGKAQAFWNGTKKFAGWMRRDFAEFFFGSWALIIGWSVFALIFGNFLIMDGTFSRGLGEGSGVNPDRFQQVGWAYRIFAALFMMLAIKLMTMGLKRYAWAIRAIGLAITVIVILHATGFGLKALEGKRDGAESVVAVAEAKTATNDAQIAQLRKQIADIDAGLAKSIAPINSEIAGLDNDGSLANDRRSDNLRERRAKLEDKAAADKEPLNSKLSELIASGGVTKTENAAALATNEEWSPLFVGLAQLFTWSQHPTDWAIYLCGVIFLIFWVIVGDAIAIVTPSALYAIHLADAKSRGPRKVVIDPDAFKDLQEQADELARRKAKLGEGAEKAVKTKGKKKKVAEARAAIEDMRTELAKREAADKQKIADAIAEMGASFEDIEDEIAEAEAGEPEPDVEPEPEAEAEEPADEVQPEQQEELLLADEVVEDSEPEQEPEYQVPAVIETDTPANDEDEEQPPRIQAAE